jgi:heme/copper-type cytochrome/quinol oxidase subunit 2
MALLVVLVAGAGVADAVETPATAEAGTMSFGLLGPVGLAAVILGVVGMTLGVIRQRRKAAAQQQAEPVIEASDEPTQPALTPYRRPTL